ncbi:MAG: hypothetical protein JW781_03200 [Deltaproteobacteria bacterium]|nr:hypothetical protein [Candidatus Anaeroferrophillacea bacterium]
MADDSLLQSGYFQVTAGAPGAAVTAAERGRTKIVSRRRDRREGRRRPNGSRPAAGIDRERLQEVMTLLGRLHDRLLAAGRDINFTIIAESGGYQLRAYDCGTDHQICRLMHERFLHSPERLEQLILDAVSGMGVLLDING